MTVNDLIKRLKKIDGDKMVLHVDENGGWSNIELVEKEHDVHLYNEHNPLFHD